MPTQKFVLATVAEVREDKEQVPRAVHEGQGGGVAPGDTEQDDKEPVEAVPVEEDGPQPLHPRGSIVAEEEEGDEEETAERRHHQSAGRGLGGGE